MMRHRILLLLAVFPLTLSGAGRAVPVAFEANRGQAEAGVLYVGHSRAGTLLLSSRAAELRSPGGSRITLQPEGASGVSRVEPEAPTGAVSNYLLGADRSHWIRHVPQYARVRYREIYPGIDLIFHGADDALEYDLVVRPGADPSAVHLRYRGARSISLDAGGNLVLITAAGRVEHRRPVIYQESKSGRQSVRGEFVLHGQVVSFWIGSYERARPLVIDPVVVYGTFLGGFSRDSASAVAVDSAGSAYVTGSTVSSDFPTTPNALQVKHGGVPNTGFTTPGSSDISDVFVAKFSPDGSKLVYSTFLGGTGTDQGFAIGVDRSGNAIIAGRTASPNFPLTTGAIQKTPPPFGNAGFVSKLNADGSDLIYSTYLGGAGGNTQVQALAMDSSGAVYVAGQTDGATFPVTTGAFQTSVGGGTTDGFVAKLNPQGTALAYSTRLGGKGTDSVLAIAVSPAGNIYVTGSTTSEDFPVSSGAVQSKIAAAGSPDAFVVELSSTGAALLYGTYFGGTATDTGNAIALDSDGSVVIAGTTFSVDFPVSQGAYQTAFASPNPLESDAFVVRLNPAGAVQYATLLGGSGEDSAQGITIAADSSVIVIGQTGSADFPVSSDAYQSKYLSFECGSTSSIIPVTGNFPPCRTVFLTTVHVSGRRLVYSTFLGGSGIDTAGGIALASDGALYLAGSTGSIDFPVTQGAFQTQKKVNTCVFQPSPSATQTFNCEDAFLVKIDPSAAGPPRPLATLANVTNGVTGAIAPGELVGLFGLGIGPAVAAGAQLDSRGFLSGTLSGTSVTFNGIPAPLLYAGPNQINAIVPFGIAAATTATVAVSTASYAAIVSVVPVANTAPGLVSISGTGQNQAAALNQDGTINSASHPAARGSIIVLFGTGAGQTSPGGIDGHIAASPAPLPVAQVSLTIGGQPAQVLYAGGAPGLVEGVLQVNAVIPDGISPGSQVPVVLTAGGKTSQPLLTVSVQ